VQNASALQLAGAWCFGLLIGWFVYFVNRYRTETSLSDIGALAGVVGGGAVLTLFPEQTDLFGAYGIGLAMGFFAYLGGLALLVKRSDNFDWDWFLDGRRRRLEAHQEIPEGVAQTVHPMGPDAPKQLPGE
jgi:hypothetical protein